MRHVPWITILAAAFALASPLGQDVVYSAFLSGEQLSRNIWQPLFFFALAVVLLLGALEWWIRRAIRKRREGG